MTRPGPYARLMGDWHSHPKVLALSAAAKGVLACCYSYSALHRTDGVVPSSAMRAWATDRELKTVLRELTLGPRPFLLTDPATVGAKTASYAISDWAEVNVARAEDDARRARDASRQARHRSATGPPVTRDRARDSTRDGGVTAPVTKRVTSDQDQDQDQDPEEDAVRISRSVRSAREAQQEPGSNGLRPFSEPESEREPDLLARIGIDWRRAYERVRGMPSADADDATKRAITRHLNATHGPSSPARHEQWSRVLEAYWADPWTRARGNRPSIKNLWSRWDALAATQQPDEDPADWTPQHGPPKSARNFVAWNRYLDRLETGTA